MAYDSIRSGVMTTINAVANNQVPDIDAMLFLLEPHQTPMSQWLHFNNLAPAEKVINANGYFQWFEDEYVPLYTTLTGAGITGGSSSEDNIGLTLGTIFAQYDILLVESSEQMVYVDSVASSEVDITHIDGSTNITAAATGTIRKIGSYNHEYDTTREAISTKEIEKNNYCTIFSESVKTSGRYQAGDKYTGGKTHKDQVVKKTKEMKQQYENNFMFSTGSGTNTVSTNYRMTYGIGFLGRVTTNETSYSGTLSEDALDDYCRKVFAKGSSIKMHFCGGHHLVEINKIVKDRYQVVPNPATEIYGVNLTEYITPFGRMQIIYHPEMTGKFSYFGFTVDREHIKLRYMADDDTGSRKFRIEENVQTPGTDGKTSKLLADQGFEITNEELHGILYKSGAS